MSAPAADGSVTTGPAPDAVPPGPGQALRAAREAAGLSVEQVSESTRIRAALVRDLEADRFHSSGGAVYARGHLRALCRAVGTPPEPLVALLDRCTGSAVEPVGDAVPVPAPVARTSTLAVPVPAPPERRGPRWTAAAVVAGVTLVGVVVTSALVGAERRPEELRLLTGPAPSAALSAEAAPPPPPPPAPAPITAELAVTVRGEESWISVSSPTETVFEGVVRDGFAEVFRHPEQLRLVVGNAGAVAVRCSGTDSGALGRRGAVQRLTCGVGGLVPA